MDAQRERWDGGPSGADDAPGEGARVARLAGGGVKGSAVGRQPRHDGAPRAAVQHATLVRQSHVRHGDVIDGQRLQRAQRRVVWAGGEAGVRGSGGGRGKSPRKEDDALREAETRQ